MSMNFEQQLQNLVGQHICKKEIKDHTIIDALKKHGIPGNRASIYYKNYSMSFLIRKIWHFRFILETDYKVNNPRAFLMNLIEYNKFPEPERFHEWVKQKQNQYKQTDYPVLYNNF